MPPDLHSPMAARQPPRTSWQGRLAPAPPASGSPRTSHAPAAFTLLESLVSLGVLLVCVAILLPTLDRAQRSAKNVRCTANLRLLIFGVRHYADHFEGALPGSPWTSAAHLRQPQDFTDPSLIPLGVSSPTTQPSHPGPSSPLSPFDWATPTIAELGLTPSLPPNSTRQDRFAALTKLSVLRCPENHLPALPIPNTSTTDTRTTVTSTTDTSTTDTSTTDSWPIVQAPSYVANLDFLVRSSRPATHTSPPSPYVASEDAQVQLYYRPRLRDVGNLSTKVFLVEGTGQLSPRASRISYSTALFPTNPEDSYFTHPRPYAATSTTGQPNPLLLGNNADPTVIPFSAATNPDSPPEGFFLLATARHGTSSADAPLTAYRLNLAFLDGHIENRNILNALDPRLHSPKGTALDVRRDTIYPRIILTHLAGKEPSVFVVP